MLLAQKESETKCSFLQGLFQDITRVAAPIVIIAGIVVMLVAIMRRDGK